MRISLLAALLAASCAPAIRFCDHVPPAQQYEARALPRTMPVPCIPTGMGTCWHGPGAYMPAELIDVTIHNPSFERVTFAIRCLSADGRETRSRILVLEPQREGDVVLSFSPTTLEFEPPAVCDVKVLKSESF